MAITCPDCDLHMTAVARKLRVVGLRASSRGYDAASYKDITLTTEHPRIFQVKNMSAYYFLFVILKKHDALLFYRGYVDTLPSFGTSSASSSRLRKMQEENEASSVRTMEEHYETMHYFCKKKLNELNH